MKTILSMVALATSFCTLTTFGQEKADKQQKVLVAFFSHTGENYSVGYIEKGNTHILAEMIAEETQGDLFEIETVKEYPKTYNACIEIAKQEQNDKARPELKADVAVEDYDIIYLGYPNGWGDMPMAVYTFIEKHNWQDKIIVPFCTHEGSGLSSTPRNIQNACKGATVQKGLAVRGSIAQNSPDQAKKTVKKFLGS